MKIVRRVRRALRQKKRRYTYPRTSEPDAKSGRFESFTYSHRFNFTQNASAFSFARKILTFSFTMGQQADFFWEGINIMDSRASSPSNTDQLQDIYISFFTRGGQQPHQSEPVRASLYRGAGFNSSSATTYALPYRFPELTLVPKGDIIRIDIENKRATTASIDVSCHGFRWYDL